MNGKIIELARETFQHNIKTKTACGGAPIIIEYIEGIIFIVGIHNNISNNTACRLTESKVKIL
jgi:hypothetical protein